MSSPWKTGKAAANPLKWLWGRITKMKLLKLQRGNQNISKDSRNVFLPNRWSALSLTPEPVHFCGVDRGDAKEIFEFVSKCTCSMVCISQESDVSIACKNCLFHYSFYLCLNNNQGWFYDWAMLGKLWFLLQVNFHIHIQQRFKCTPEIYPAESLFEGF